MPFARGFGKAGSMALIAEKFFDAVGPGLFAGFLARRLVFACRRVIRYRRPGSFAQPFCLSFSNNCRHLIVHAIRQGFWQGWIDGAEKSSGPSLNQIATPSHFGRKKIL